MSNLMMTVALAAKGKFQRFLYNEEGEVNIVTTVVLIGIAITLAVVFKNGVKTLLNTLLANINQSATQAIK